MVRYLLAVAALLFILALPPAVANEPLPEPLAAREEVALPAPEPLLHPVSRGGPRRMRVVATAYTANDPGMDGKGIMYTGYRVDRGAIAVDPRVISLGSVVHVPGYGWAVALDTGSAIRGNRIDVFFHDLARAREWGRREVEVTVYRLGN